MKMAHVHKFARQWFLEPDDQTTAGVWIGAATVLSLEEDGDAVEKGRLAMEVLALSKSPIPHPVQWSSPNENPVVKAAGAGTWAAFMRKARLLGISLDSQSLIIVPYRNLGARKGFTEIGSKAVTLPADSSWETIGANLDRVMLLAE